MKKISFFIFLTLLSTNLEAGRLAKCYDHCKQYYVGSIFDKSTELGVCIKGCDLSHWIGKKKAKEKCWKRNFGSAICLVGARNY